MEYVSCFFKGLNDPYNNISTQILLMDSLIVQQEVFVPQSSLQTIQISYDTTKEDVTLKPLCYVHIASKAIT